MSINVREDCKSLPLTRAELDEDLKNCMQCRFFHGNNHQCILNNCINEAEEKKADILNEDHICYQCPYRNNEGYCFPCMKKILSKKDDSEKKEDKNG